ncbi:MAG TPA: outer membrane beta-barrel protein, partial [Kofleriaceae bacterium]
TDAARPTGLAVGIGLGYLLPTSLQTPNITSVRVRLASGLTFEPQLVVANTSDKVDTGGTTTNKQTELAIATVARYPLRVHRKVDLELLGNAGISTRLVNPAGDNNDRTITTLDVGYGIGLGYWFTPHWNLSLSASNPLLTYARTRQEMTADNVTVTSSTTIGLVFDPEVTLMIHLFD